MVGLKKIKIITLMRASLDVLRICAVRRNQMLCARHPCADEVSATNLNIHNYTFNTLRLRTTDVNMLDKPYFLGQ